MVKNHVCEPVIAYPIRNKKNRFYENSDCVYRRPAECTAGQMLRRPSLDHLGIGKWPSCELSRSNLCAASCKRSKRTKQSRIECFEQEANEI